MTLINRILISAIVKQDKIHIQEQFAALKTPIPEIFSECQLKQYDEYYHSIAKFTSFLDERVESANPFNDRELITHLKKEYGVLKEGVSNDYSAVQEMRLSFPRNDIQPVYTLILRQIALCIICGTTKDKALIFDREGRIIDGCQRLAAYQTLRLPYYSMTVNFVHEADRRGLTNRK
jgi:hypothetical protein